jgi:hypothetical protein
MKHGERPTMRSDDENSNSALIPSAPCVSNEMLANDLNEVKVIVYEIKGALKGNEYGNLGLINRADKSEKRMDELEVRQEDTERKLIKWSGIGAGVALAIGLIKDWIFPHRGG